MQTIEQVQTPEPVVDNEVGALKKRIRRLSWLSGVLVVVVLGLGAWLLFGDSGTSDADLTAEQEQMLETINGHVAAWNDGDGAGVVAFMASPTSYHDNGTGRIPVADGELEAYVDRLGSQSFSVRSSASDGDAAFVGNFVMTTDYIPETSETPRPSIYKMTPDGTAVVWHYVP
jgi:hypothetical protein